MIDKLIAKRALGTSSDSAPQYVIRQKSVNGELWTKSGLGLWTCGVRAAKSIAGGQASWLKQWPEFADALTTTPAEPRMFDTVYFKSVGVDVQSYQPALAEASQGAAREAAERLAHLQRRHDLLKRYA